jgi:NitT/TauT family transport system permease protein
LSSVVVPFRPARSGRATRALRLVGVVVRATAAIAVFLAAWEILPRAGVVDRTFLVPFSEVASAWWDLVRAGTLGDHVRASLQRALLGFGIAVAVAVPLGLLIGWYATVGRVIGPLLELFRNTAPLALLPVFVLILGIGETSKVAMVVYGCSWPILLNTVSAVRQVDPLLIRSARSMGLASPALFAKVILPASVPTIFTGIRLAGQAAMLVLIAAEMVGANEGLGYLINSSQFNFAIPQMYAGIVTIAGLGVAVNYLLLFAERRFSRWRTPLGPGT